ncbi:hypothetical protein KJ766_00770 [Patescibacteria group bacterium]|nr:hypothetical protein [Patescibacteria group bacterium]
MAQFVLEISKSRKAKKLPGPVNYLIELAVESAELVHAWTSYAQASYNAQIAFECATLFTAILQDKEIDTVKDMMLSSVAMCIVFREYDRQLAPIANHVH